MEEQACGRTTKIEVFDSHVRQEHGTEHFKFFEEKASGQEGSTKLCAETHHAGGTPTKTTPTSS
jgi:hypothetical protein